MGSLSLPLSSKSNSKMHVSQESWICTKSMMLELGNALTTPLKNSTNDSKNTALAINMLTAF